MPGSNAVDRTVTVPATLAETIDELARRYSELTGDDIGSAMRLIEIAVVQRGCLAVMRDIDSITPPGGERVA